MSIERRSVHYGRGKKREVVCPYTLVIKKTTGASFVIGKKPSTASEYEHKSHISPRIPKKETKGIVLV